MKSYKVPGLANPVYMPVDVPVTIDLVPASRGNIRSNQKRSASQVTKYTQHETANFNAGANARMHRNYLHNGAGGAYVGFNSVNDDREVIVLTPYDEVTWAAGTATGNLVSDHHELCVNSDINHTKARQISAAWAAGVIHARGLTVAGALVQHNVWYGKNCPLLLRRDGLWPSYVNMVAAYYAQIVAYTKGGKVDPVPAGLAKGDTVKATDNLNLRQGSGTSYKALTTLPAGTVATIIDGPRSADGYQWYDIKGDFGTGWVAADWLTKTEPAKPDPKPTPAWPYPDPVVPGFWAELMKDGATHVFDGGYLWVRTENLYRVASKTKRQQYAMTDDRVVGPDLEPGTVFRAAAIGQSGMDKEAWVITPGLTRVRLSDLAYVDEDEESAASAA